MATSRLVSQKIMPAFLASGGRQPGEDGRANEGTPAPASSFINSDALTVSKFESPFESSMDMKLREHRYDPNANRSLNMPKKSRVVEVKPTDGVRFKMSALAEQGKFLPLQIDGGFIPGIELHPDGEVTIPRVAGGLKGGMPITGPHPTTGENQYWYDDEHMASDHPNRPYWYAKDNKASTWYKKLPADAIDVCSIDDRDADGNELDTEGKIERVREYAEKHNYVSEFIQKAIKQLRIIDEDKTKLLQWGANRRQILKNSNLNDQYEAYRTRDKKLVEWLEINEPFIALEMNEYCRKNQDYNKSTKAAWIKKKIEEGAVDTRQMDDVTIATISARGDKKTASSSMSIITNEELRAIGITGDLLQKSLGTFHGNRIEALKHKKKMDSSILPGFGEKYSYEEEQFYDIFKRAITTKILTSEDPKAGRELLRDLNLCMRVRKQEMKKLGIKIILPDISQDFFDASLAYGNNLQNSYTQPSHGYTVPAMDGGWTAIPSDLPPLENYQPPGVYSNYQQLGSSSGHYSSDISTGYSTTSAPLSYSAGPQVAQYTSNSQSNDPAQDYYGGSPRYYDSSTDQSYLPPAPSDARQPSGTNPPHFPEYYDDGYSAE